MKMMNVMKQSTSGPSRNIFALLVAFIVFVFSMLSVSLAFSFSFEVPGAIWVVGALGASLGAIVIYVVLRRFDPNRPIEERLRAVFEEVNDGVVLLKGDWTIADCNPAYCHILGEDSPEELVGRSVMEFSPEFQRDGTLSVRAVETIQQSVRTGTSTQFLWLYQQRSGELIDVEISPKRIELGEQIYFLSVVRNIGDRLSVERRRRRVEKNNQVLLELYDKAQSLNDEELYDFVLGHALALTGSEMGFLQLLSDGQEPLCPTIWSVSDDSLCSRGKEAMEFFGDLGSWEDYELFSRPYINNDFAAESGAKESPVVLERFMSIPVVEDDKVRIIFAVCNKMDRYDELDSLQLQLIANELHKVLRQRFLMRELEAREAALGESQRIARMGSWMHDLSSDQMDWSRETFSVLGLDPQKSEPSRFAFIGAIAPEDREMVLGSYTEAIRNHAPYDVEHRIVQDDGTVRHVRERCEIFYADDATPLYSIGTIQDVTERVEWLDHVRRESEQNAFLLSVYERAEMLSDKELFFMVLDHAVSLTGSDVGGLFLVSEDGQRMESALWSGEHMESCASAFLDHCPLADLGGWADSLRKKQPVIYNNYGAELEGGQLPEGHPDLHRILSVSAQEKGARGVIIGVGNKADDYQELDLTQINVVVQELHRILKQRFLMRALEDRESSLQEAQRIARIGSWTYDIPTEKMVWTEEVYRIVGVEPYSIDPTQEQIQNFIHPDDREWSHDAYITSVERGTIYEEEYRVVTGEGDVRHVHVRCEHEYSSDGTPLCSVGTVQDVTERVQMRAALEKRLVSLTRPSGDIGDIAFEDLFNLNDIQRLQDKFSSATGVASVIISPDGSALTNPSNEPEAYVGLICQNDDCSEAYRRSMRALGERHAAAAVVAENAEFGLWSAGASIVVGGTHVATWVIGPVRMGECNLDFIRSCADKLQVGEGDFSSVYETVPVFSLEQFSRVGDALFSVANQISDSAYMNLQQARFIMDERRRTEELRLLSTAIGQANDVVMITNLIGQIEYVNPAFETVTGYSFEEVKGKSPSILKSGEQSASFYKKMWDRLSAGHSWSGRLWNRRKSGAVYIEEATISPVCDAQGVVTHYVAVKHDITQLVRLEEQFHQTQKMEAIGRLASGVAHDFNNILQTIYGLCGVLLLDVKEQGGVRQDIQDIYEAAKRAGDLTNQLLTFSRRTSESEAELDLNQVIDEQSSMLKRLLGRHHQLVFESDPELLHIVGDRSQVEQITMNLVINARDAMPDGGTIGIFTRNVNLDDDDARAESGDYSCVSIEDSGVGMAPEVIESLFEPFFTTKSVGEGTGLGLALIYSAVERAGGWIDVQSEVGKGSVFSVYFPVKRSKIEPDDEEFLLAEPVERNVLLLEQDVESAEFMNMVLSGVGYAILVAESVDEAQVLLGEDKHLDVLIVDELFSGLQNGRLFERLDFGEEFIPVVVLCGIENTTRNLSVDGRDEIVFLKKPFGTEALINTVERAVQRGASRFRDQRVM